MTNDTHCASSHESLDAIARIRKMERHGFALGTLCAVCARRLASHAATLEEAGVYPLCDECDPAADADVDPSDDADVDLPRRARRNPSAMTPDAIRRRELSSKGLCISGSEHGPATHGCRCAWCYAVHKLGLAAVLKLEARGEAPPRPRAPQNAALTTTPGGRMMGAMRVLMVVVMSLVVGCYPHGGGDPDALPDASPTADAGLMADVPTTAPCSTYVAMLAAGEIRMVRSGYRIIVARDSFSAYHGSTIQIGSGRVLVYAPQLAGDRLGAFGRVDAANPTQCVWEDYANN